MRFCKPWTGVLALALIWGLACEGVMARHNNNNNGNNNNNNSNNNNNGNTQQTPAAAPNPAASATPAVPSQLSQDEAAQSAAASALLVAQQKLKALSDAGWDKYQQTPEWTAAQTKLTAAQSDLDTAKQAATSALANDPDYQAALAAKKSAVDALAAARAGDDPTPETITPLATASLEASVNLRKIENKVLANDTGVQAATENLTVAQHNADLLKEKFQQSMLLDKDYAAAKSAVDTAQSTYDGAHAKVLSDSSN